jgi:hypothetical protein
VNAPALPAHPPDKADPILSWPDEGSLASTLNAVE